MTKQHAPLIPDKFYHLYNRAVGSEKLFLSEENYRYFLDRMKFHVLPVADIWSYALLPNHFHLMIKVKQENRILDLFSHKKKKPFDVMKHDLSDFIMEQFSNWLNGYAKAFNKMYHRKGGLFIDYTKRKMAKVDADINRFIFYIHKNAVHHGLARKIGDWKFDSYQPLLSDKPTWLMRDDVMNWFGSREEFIDFHTRPIDIYWTKPKFSTAHKSGLTSPVR
jgi:putative transposase